ncbi:MAG: hypothetical protein LKM39_01335 [Chiayiivirga sp.]|nr:hypothetical protein [Chiayiivirga sp.]
MPQAGIIVNIITRIAMVAPATASLPMLARMRIRKIHEVIATIIWPTPPSEVRTMFHSTARRATRVASEHADVLAAAEQDPQLHQHARAAADVGGDRRAFDCPAPAPARSRRSASDQARC